MKELIRKLSSRKMWAAIAAFVVGLILAFGGSQETAYTVEGCIMSGGAMIAYILAEGYIDGKAIEKKKEGEGDEGN